MQLIVNCSSEEREWFSDKKFEWRIGLFGCEVTCFTFSSHLATLTASSLLGLRRLAPHVLICWLVYFRSFPVRKNEAAPVGPTSHC